jgi:hypothetical protein
MLASVVIRRDMQAVAVPAHEVVGSAPGDILVFNDHTEK